MTTSTQRKLEYNRARAKRKYDFNKTKSIEYLGSKCAWCNSDEELEIDHVDPENKNYNVSTRFATYTFASLIEELDKCQLLCKDCHREKTNEEMEVPHGGGARGKHNCKCFKCRVQSQKYMEKYAEGKSG